MGGRHCQMWFLTRQCLFCTSAVSLLFGATRRVIPELFRKSRHSLLSSSETELSNPAALSSLSPSLLYYQFPLIYRGSQQTLYQFIWLFNCFLYAVMEFFHFVIQAPFPKGTFPGEGCWYQAPLTVRSKLLSPYNSVFTKHKPSQLLSEHSLAVSVSLIPSLHAQQL